MPTIIWWQVIVGFVLGALLGQRFVHLHPVQSVRSANGVDGQ